MQGVGFRYFIKEKADELELSGWVSNLDDGSVEILAQGDKAKLVSLLEQVKQGPNYAKTENIEVSWQEEMGQKLDFFEIQF